MNNYETLIFLSAVNIGFIIMLVTSVHSSMHNFAKHKDEDRLYEKLSQHTIRYGLMVTLLSVYLMYQWGKYSSEEHLSMPVEEPTEIYE